jgi:DNA polymerase-1
VCARAAIARGGGVTCAASASLHRAQDGNPGRDRVLPPLDELQRDPATRDAWIEYSTYDAEATWKLRAALEAKLRAMHWIGGDSLWDFYNIYLVPFAECLTDLERAGIHVATRTTLH